MMATVECRDPKRLWRDRAKSVGLKVIAGHYIEDMTEKQAEEAFDLLSSRYGISYVWNN